MRVILLPDEPDNNLYDYLLHVVRSHTGAGIVPEEGLLAYNLYARITQAQAVDLANAECAQETVQQLEQLKQQESESETPQSESGQV
jgi:hypothetical protein